MSQSWQKQKESAALPFWRWQLPDWWQVLPHWPTMHRVISALSLPETWRATLLSATMTPSWYPVRQTTRSSTPVRNTVMMKMPTAVVSLFRPGVWQTRRPLTVMVCRGTGRRQRHGHHRQQRRRSERTWSGDRYGTQWRGAVGTQRRQRIRYCH